MEAFLRERFTEMQALLQLVVKIKILDERERYREEVFEDMKEQWSI